MTITYATLETITDALDRIFDTWTDGNHDSFTVKGSKDIETRVFTWGVNLASRGTQTTEDMDKTIARLTLANNICKALNELEIVVDYDAPTVIDALVAAGRKERAMAICEQWTACLANTLEHFLKGYAARCTIEHMDENFRCTNI